ncbi:MAG: peptidylprolyl isomerase [Deltaproteobacteria bacterium]|nr:peptidylprolyl isomerase [Deltaproteobacteria bacterium]
MLARRLCCVLLFALLAASPAPARAVVVERVVAVVGEKAILATDLRGRARPFLVQLYAKIPAGPQRAAAESQMLEQLLERMVDEELESRAAARGDARVTSEDVDSALRNIARLGGVGVSQLLSEVQAASGMTEQEYREEIRRQVLEGKLLQRLVEDRIRVSDRDLQAAFERAVREELGVRLYHPAWIVLRAPAALTPEAKAERALLGRELAARARKGEDFAELARRYSDDADTREQGGDLGVRAPQGSPAAMSRKRPVLAREIEAVVMKLEPGEVADPVPYRDALVVLTVLSRQPSHYTSIEAARPELLQRLKATELEKAKYKWLKDLRRRTHVDVRL